jgi:hypothetical protein
MTSYFWMVRARQERPCLNVFQLGGFRTTLRRRDKESQTKTLSITLCELGGVLVANNSIRQTSIIRFDCWLMHEGNWLKGRWGYMNEDKPPWNIGPETTIAINPACFFEVPLDFETPDDCRFYVEFISVSGKRFGHQFSMDAPEL